MISKRLGYLDVAKGAFILLLLLHHFQDATSLYGVTSPYFNVFASWQSLYTAFFMQAFFFISGYCSNFNRTFKEFVVINAKSILIPVITLTFISAIVEWIVVRGQYYFIRPWDVNYWIYGPYWFLYALFLSKVFVWIMNKMKLSSLVCYFMSILMIPIALWMNKSELIPNYFCIYHAFTATFFVYFGMWMKKNPTIYNNYISYCWWVYPIVLFCIKALHYDIVSLTAGLWVMWYETPLFLLCTLTGIPFALFICKKISSDRVLEFFGQNSLAVYGVHYTFIGVIGFIFNKHILSSVNFVNSILLITFSLIMTIILCTFVIYLLKNKYLKVLMGNF